MITLLVSWWLRGARLLPVEVIGLMWGLADVVVSALLIERRTRS